MEYMAGVLKNGGARLEEEVGAWKTSIPQVVGKSNPTTSGRGKKEGDANGHPLPSYFN
jgi:hypothetical protein